MSRARGLSDESGSVVLRLLITISLLVAIGSAGRSAAAEFVGQWEAGRWVLDRFEREPASEGGDAVGVALTQLKGLRVAGRGPKTGYDRDGFGSGWVDTNRNGCDTRNDILRRDSRPARLAANNCTVLSGTLADPYTGTLIRYKRGSGNGVDIEHVVALGNAWQSGAATWSTAKREKFANDPRNLLAVSASANRAKGDANAASWLPPNKAYRCTYVARQVAVKSTYRLTVTPSELAAIRRVLTAC